MNPKEDLERIARAALKAADPGPRIKACLRLQGSRLRVGAPGASRDFDLSRFRRLLVLGLGKAAGLMARALEEVLGARIDEGLIVSKPGPGTGLKRTRQIAGGHPVPDETSVQAAGQVVSLADSADEQTLVITLISGGGSSLLAAPAGAGISLSDIQETVRQLLCCGASIQEINCIRKHLLLLAGGRLARRLSPAATISLVLSDVVGDDLSTIASGPTYPDPTTYDQALAILDEYGIRAGLPGSVVALLADGAAGRIPETPKPGEPEFSRVFNVLVGGNLLALEGASEEARRMGYTPLILTSRLAGEAREAARVLAAVARDAAAAGFPCPPPACILSGGETTVTVRGNGRGGRNQEMALAFLAEMEKGPELPHRVRFLSFSTDGEDGPTEAAGGFALGLMAEAARRRGMRIAEALRANDSHTFLEALDGLFITGPTGTNVCDIQIALVD